MTQLGGPVPPILSEIRSALLVALNEHRYSLVDADSLVTGRDFLLKIWEMIVAVPLGIAIIHEEMRPGTLANVFYELGLMQAYGKETLVIKTEAATVPSDLVRTEYVQFGADFPQRIGRYLRSLETHRADFFAAIARQVENTPLLALDYLLRAYLLSGEVALKRKARALLRASRSNGGIGSGSERLLVGLD
jgi:hypothetical protein